ncbi:hypothetical protein ACIG5E_34285 [Kitasatospora sp. NPDC053057]
MDAIQNHATTAAIDPEETEQDETGLRPATDGELLGLTVSGQ